MMGLIQYMNEHRAQLLITLVTYIGHITYGFRCESTGIALLDLQIQVQESFSFTSRLVTLYSIGYLVGACLAGYIESVCNNFIVQTISCIFGGIIMFVFPLFSNIYLLFPLSAMNGFLNAILETVSCVVIIDVWGKEMGNYMQLLFCAFGVGGLITPLMMRPYQLPMPEELIDDPDSYLAFYKPDEVQIKYPYFYASFASILVGIGFLLCYYFYRSTDSSDRKKTANDNKNNQNGGHEVITGDKNVTEIKLFKKAIAVMWVALLGHVGFALQLVFCVFSQAYGVMSSLRMEKRQAALLATVYWVNLSASKLVFMVLSRYIGEKILIVVCTLTLSIGSILSFTGATNHEIYYWLVAIFFGWGFGPLFVIAYSELEKYFHLTGKHTSIICICFVLGESIHVPAVGQFIEKNPDIFLYYCGTLAAIFVVAFIALPFICKALFGDLRENGAQEVTNERKGSRFCSTMITVTERRESIIFSHPESSSQIKHSNALQAQAIW